MPRSQSHVGPLITAAACWGLGAVASKRAVAEIPPAALLSLQLVASTGALALISVAAKRRILPAVNRLRHGLLGLLNPGLAYMFSLAGLASITAGLSVLLWALEPILILGLAALALGERLSRRAIVLSGVAVLGAAVAGAAGTAGAAMGGVALTLAGVGCCAVYTVLASSRLEGASTLGVVVFQQAWALGFAFALMIGYRATGGVIDVGAVSPGAWASAAASGVLYYGLAFWAYLTGLRRTRASTAAAFLNLIPVFGIGGGLLFLGERMVLWQAAGAALTILAVGSMASAPAACPAH